MKFTLNLYLIKIDKDNSDDTQHGPAGGWVAVLLRFPLPVEPTQLLFKRVAIEGAVQKFKF